MARWCVLFALPLAVSACSSSRLAARPPTSQERNAIVRAFPLEWRKPRPGCVRADIRISHDSRYALAGFEFLNPHHIPARCAKYESNGFWILKKTPRWKIVYEGSDPPRCVMKIPSELLSPLHCMTL